jgi:hypothetical protein
MHRDGSEEVCVFMHGVQTSRLETQHVSYKFKDVPHFAILICWISFHLRLLNLEFF